MKRVDFRLKSAYIRTMMQQFSKILFSKSVLLTYIFIGYLAIIDKEITSCVVDTLPCYSVNDEYYPSAKTAQIISAEHVRPIKQQLGHVVAILAPNINLCASCTSSAFVNSFQILRHDKLHSRFPSDRAPPFSL